MAVSHEILRRSIAAAFDASSIEFSKVSDLTRNEFERLLATAIKASVESAEFSQHIRSLK